MASESQRKPSGKEMQELAVECRAGVTGRGHGHRSWGSGTYGMPYTNESGWRRYNSQNDLDKVGTNSTNWARFPAPKGKGTYIVIVFCLESLEGRIFGLQSKEDFSNKRSVSCVWTACCRAQQKLGNWILSKMVYKSVNIKVTSKVTFSVLHIASICAEISLIFYVGQQWISPRAANVIIQQIGENIHIDSLISWYNSAPNIYLVNIWLNKSHNSEEFQREIGTSSGNDLSLTHLKDCTFHSGKDVFVFPIPVWVASVQTYPEQRRVRYIFANCELMNERNMCNAQCFSSFPRSVSLLGTRRCGSWHCNREGEGQWSGYWGKCTVILRHHWWRWNSTLWNHFWCPGPGWYYTPEKGKVRKVLFIFRMPLWNLKSVGAGWTSWQNLRAVGGLPSLAVRK